jgi:thioester dehydrase family protein
MPDLTCPITDIAPLVPHSGKMIMLDKILDFGTDFLIAEMEVRPDNVFLRGERLPSFLGAEIMAQGVAAWDGCKCAQLGKPIGLGYWLGSRKLSIHRPYIAMGSKLRIQIKLSIEDASGFGVFDCQLIDANSQQIIVEGALNVFRPQA